MTPKQETMIEDAYSEIVEEHIRSIPWPPYVPDDVRTVVAGNIRNFSASISRRWYEALGSIGAMCFEGPLEVNEVYHQVYTALVADLSLPADEQRERMRQAINPWLGDSAYEHVEAFKLMRYASRDASVQEILWNSRDGVTPFIIHNKDGVELNHVAFKSDVRVTNLVPPAGMRVFVTMTPEARKKYAREWCERHWEQGLNKHHRTKEAAMESWIANLHEDEPDIITVDGVFQATLLDRYRSQGIAPDTRRVWDIYQFHRAEGLRKG